LRKGGPSQTEWHKDQTGKSEQREKPG
jgi:hypothetical protein